MTSRIDIFENFAISENHSNGQAQAGMANGSQPVTHWHPNHEKDQSSQQKVQERERLALLGTSAAVFAHEVGNPLQAIFLSIEFIESEFNRKQIADPVLISTIEATMREIVRLRSLLHEFRSLAKPQTLDLQSSDLVKIVEEVLALQKLGCQAAGIAVKFESEKRLPPILLDKAKISQALLNLCKNAVEAMPQGGCLSIRLHPSGSMVVMEVADNGVGVPDDVSIFELFKTTKPAGSGLGLPIVQQIILAHKGTIDYINQPGSGATFIVNLPAEIRK